MQPVPQTKQHFNILRRLGASNFFEARVMSTYKNIRRQQNEDFFWFLPALTSFFNLQCQVKS